MKNFVIDLSLMAFFSLSGGQPALFAQENPQGGPLRASASIQQQIDVVAADHSAHVADRHGDDQRHHDHRTDD